MLGDFSSLTRVRHAVWQIRLGRTTYRLTASLATWEHHFNTAIFRDVGHYFKSIWRSTSGKHAGVATNCLARIDHLFLLRHPIKRTITKHT